MYFSTQNIFAVILKILKILLRTNCLNTDPASPIYEIVIVESHFKDYSLR